MRISLLVAMADNGVIGLGGNPPFDLPWHLPADLKRFKRLTTGHVIVMGRRTFESIGRPLPRRRSLVITRAPDYRYGGPLARGAGVTVVHGFDEALAAAAGEEEVFVIGGAEIFALALPRAERLYLTRVHAEVDGDVRFPALDFGEWQLAAAEPHAADERHAYAFTFERWERSRPTTMPKPYSRVDEIDWQTWSPVDHATLLFVVEDGRILLIRKKRGLGAGKINGPGGRLDPGETPLDGAMREVEEEVGVVPAGIRAGGELSFQFVDGYSVHVYVFSATGYRGKLRETDEAIPLWADLDRIPYDEMWVDDRLWLPLLLDAQPFAGRFIFDGDEMLDHHLVVGPTELTRGG